MIYLYTFLLFESVPYLHCDTYVEHYVEHVYKSVEGEGEKKKKEEMDWNCTDSKELNSTSLIALLSCIISLIYALTLFSKKRPLEVEDLEEREPLLGSVNHYN